MTIIAGRRASEAVVAMKVPFRSCESEPGAPLGQLSMNHA
jgi:hypothetical protein